VLGRKDPSLLRFHPLRGAVFRTWVASEHHHKGNNMSVPSKAKAIKLVNPAQEKFNQQPVTELHMLGGNE